jgi:hypothetical protein
MLRLVLRALVAFTLLGAAVIHAAQAPSHLAEWWAAGVVFVALAAAQAMLGVAAAAGADRRVWRLAQAVSLAVIGLWAISRTVGLPVGPEAGEPEPVGRADLAAVALEAATVLAATLLAWPGARVARRRPGRSATAAVLAVAVLTGAATWSGLQPTSVCDAHDADQAQLGPLVPVEGHSLLAASTPTATAVPGQHLGLVVGLLRNCATGPISVQAAQLLNQDGAGHTATTGRFLIATVPPAQPGIILLGGQLASMQPLPGRVTVQPAPEAPTHALIVELHTRRPGSFRVDAVKIGYQHGGRGYTAPFATNAQLTISQQHHQAARLHPAERSPVPAWRPWSPVPGALTGPSRSFLRCLIGGPDAALVPPPVPGRRSNHGHGWPGRGLQPPPGQVTGGAGVLAGGRCRRGAPAPARRPRAPARPDRDPDPS